MFGGGKRMRSSLALVVVCSLAFQAAPLESVEAQTIEAPPVGDGGLAVDLSAIPSGAVLALKPESSAADFTDPPDPNLGIEVIDSGGQ